MVAGRTYDITPLAEQAFVGKKDTAAAAVGYSLYLDEIAAVGYCVFRVGDGTLNDQDESPPLTDGQAFVTAGVRNTTDDDLEGFADGIGSETPVTDPTTATLANGFPLRIGASSNTPDLFFDGEIYAVALWREALTNADVAIAGDELTLVASTLSLLGVG